MLKEINIDYYPHHYVVVIQWYAAVSGYMKNVFLPLMYTSSGCFFPLFQGKISLLPDGLLVGVFSF
jgi:hypothetical protein